MSYSCTFVDLFKQVERVPLTSRLVKVDQYRLVESGSVEAKTDDPCRAILDAPETLAILLGPAGFGKSTTTFRLAQASARWAIYVPAAAITKSVHSTSSFLKQAISTEELLKDSELEDFETHETVAREVLSRILKREDASFYSSWTGWTSPSSLTSEAESSD